MVEELGVEVRGAVHFGAEGGEPVLVGHVLEDGVLRMGRLAICRLLGVALEGFLVLLGGPLLLGLFLEWEVGFADIAP